MTSGDERVRESIQLAADRRIPLMETGKSELDRLTDGSVHQGIALQVRPYRYAHPDDLVKGRAPLIVAVDGITDPRNLGAIVRSAAAFGATGVVVPERRAAGVTAGAWKSSAGTLATVPVAQATNLARQLKAYQKAGCFVAGLDSGGGVAVADIEVAAGPFVLVVGSEGKGLGKLVADTCDLLVTIPMPGAAEFLNAACRRRRSRCTRSPACAADAYPPGVDPPVSQTVPPGVSRSSTPPSARAVRSRSASG